MTALDSVFDPPFLRKLDCLRLTVRHSLATRPGNTPMPHGSQPTGMEPASYQAYAPGDDPRYVDWSAYGRLEQMLVKRFRAEREAPLHLLIDTSASMGVPASDGKLPFAAALAASLAYVSLRRHDPVRIVTMGGRHAPLHSSPLFRHVGRIPELRAFLDHLEAHGPTRFDEATEAYLRATQPPGVVVVLSDFLVSPAVYESALDRLRARGCAVAALRLIGPEERHPPVWPRRVRLRDAETGSERLVNLTAAQHARYVAAVDHHLAALKRWCASRTLIFASPDTHAGIESCLFDALPRSGLLR